MKIKDGQKFALLRLCQKYIKGRNGRLFLVGKILKKEIQSFDDLSITDWQIIRNFAYDNWSNDDWTISNKFANLAMQISDEYEISLGQGMLF